MNRKADFILQNESIRIYLFKMNRESIRIANRNALAEAILAGWLSGYRVQDARSTGRGFKSRPLHC